MRVIPQYISVGCNRGSGTSDVDDRGLVAFAAGKVVALWNTRDETRRGVHETLPGHEALITKVRFVGRTLVSGDEAGQVRIWRTTSGKAPVPVEAVEGEEYQPSFVSLPPVAAHSKSISALAALPLGDVEGGQEWAFLLITGGSDAVIRTWRCEGDKVEPLQAFDAGGRMPLECVVARLPGSNALILALALSHRAIRIFTAASPSDEFVPALSLEGHEDWVRCLSITRYPRQSRAGDVDQQRNADVKPEEDDLMLASGSQDNYVRLWRISKVLGAGSAASGVTDAPQTEAAEGNEPDLSDAMLDEFERKMRGEGVDEGDDGGGPSGQISTKAHVIRLEGGGGSTTQYSVNLESVLIGHESWVTDLHWSPPALDSAALLLSTAADNSMILWTPPSLASTIWLARHRFGEMGGKGLGLFGGLWASDGVHGEWSVIASGWNGGFHRWGLEGEKGMEVAECEWAPEIAPTGHQNAVKDLAWDPDAEYMLSVSTDRTTRAHAPWKRPGPDGTQLATWAEVGRPQIHGYDMTCVAFLDRMGFLSGADEKVVRVFNAPKGFGDTMFQLGASDENLKEDSRVMGVSVPPLGLSNKAVMHGREPEPSTEKMPTMNEEHISISTGLDQPPTEAILAASTLWPETDKIYGHGYELMTCATDTDRRILATACKSSSAEHAKVILYDMLDGTRLGQPLEGHNLTITRIAFSHDNRYILTCSRDRTWRLFEEKQPEGETPQQQAWRRMRGDPSPEGYVPVAAAKPHARIIWDCAWAPDDRCFFTVSRDKQMKVCQPDGEGKEWKCSITQKLEEAGTAVAVTKRPGSQDYLVAVGLETGLIELYTIQTGDEWTSTLDHRIPHSLAHVGQINRLAWRYKEGPLELASCSDDRALRITRVVL